MICFSLANLADWIAQLPKPVNRRKLSVTSPPVICRNIVTVGTALGDGQVGPSADLPPGDIQGFDVRTGKRLWRFRSVPQSGEFGHETWLDGSAESPRGVSAWPPLSADEELGLIYMPFSSPSNDYYGGNRPGNNLFGSSVVCLRAQTGQRVWHFQLTHHDLWDYAPPAAPILAEIKIRGRSKKVLVQLTKQGFCFVLDRATGSQSCLFTKRPFRNQMPHTEDFYQTTDSIEATAVRQARNILRRRID